MNQNTVHPETPFVVNWSISTGDRLTRYRSTIEQFATRAEALASLDRPFGPYVANAMVRDFTAHIAAGFAGPVSVVATRKRGTKAVVK